MEGAIYAKLASLCLISQTKLASILTLCGTKKDLIIDPTFIKPLERICGVAWLRQHGVEKIYKMELNLGDTANTNRVYLIPACLIKYKCVLDQITSLLSKNSKLKELNCFHIIVVPKVLSIFESILESRGLYGIVNLYTFTWEFIALDDGVLSLEWPFLYKTTFIDRDSSFISSIALSLWSLTKVVGKPNLTLSIGKLSANILDLFEIYNETFSRTNSRQPGMEFSCLLIIDREQDYASSLFTPATYSGLLSEIFNVNCGILDLSVQETKSKKGTLDFKITPPVEQSKHSVMNLDSATDSLYGEVKYRHFSEVLSVLSAKSKQLKSEDTKKDKLGIHEMKHFVSTKLPKITAMKKFLVDHVLACETIIAEMSHKFECLNGVETDMVNNRNRKSNLTYLEENFGTDIHIHSSLRLLCLFSLTQGLSYDEYNSFITEYVHAFGHKYLYVFDNLVNSGLIIQPTVSKLQLSMPNLGNIGDRLPKWSNNFQSLASKLKQLPSYKKVDNTCPSYVFNGGYVPLVGLVCKRLLSSDSLADLLLKLHPLSEVKVGGKIIEKIDSGIGTLSERLDCVNAESSGAPNLDFGCKDAKYVLQHLRGDGAEEKLFPLKPKSILVYVVGGVSHAEIAACAVLELVTGSKIVMASDNVITGNHLIEAAM